MILTAVEYSQDVSQVCHPLTLLGIDFFQFSRVYNNGQKILLCNNGDWADIISSPAITNVKGSFSVNPDKLPERILWKAMDPNGVMQLIADRFDCTNGYTMIEKFSTHTDVYCYAAKSQNLHINHLYINNEDLLHHFKHYFKDKLNKILKNLQPNHNTFKQEPISSFNKNIISELKINTDIFLQTVDTKHFYINVDGNELQLSTREFECSKLLAQGYSIKKISDILNITPRTVRQYISNAKLKLSIYSMDELAELLKNSL